MEEALAFARPGDTLVVWRLDRLRRSLDHLIATVRQLEARGIGFRSLTEQLDTTMPGGRLIFHLFGALAELAGQRLRQRGPAPTLWDSEVLTMEIVGEYLGLEQESMLFAYFRRHDAPFFPALRQVHRTTFVRQAANLWQLKERLWQHLLAEVPHDPTFAIVDSFPLPVCQFARAYRCRRFRGEAAYGNDTLVRQTFYGLRVHVRLEWPGVITRFCVAPANIHELAVMPALAEQTTGTLVGDRNYWSPTTTAEWQRHGVELLAPYRSGKRDPSPRWSVQLSRVRYRIDTVFGQLVDRCTIKRVWARDSWHLGSRLLRKALMHTLAILVNVDLGNSPLQLAGTVAF